MGLLLNETVRPLCRGEVENAIQELSQLWSVEPADVDQNIHRNLQDLLAKHGSEAAISD